MDELKGKRALVGGASKGLGRACALEFARLGAECILAARSAEALEALCKELPAGPGRRHRWIAQDYGDPRALEACVREELKTGGPIAILLNNTGGPPPGPILGTPAESFEDAFRRHLIAAQLLMNLLVPGMRELGYGRIISILSSSVKQPIEGLGVSNAVRGAMASWAKTLAAELAPLGITVNSLLPGYISTDRVAALMQEAATRQGRPLAEVRNAWLSTIPAGRFGRPEELAAVAGFLASPAAGYVTGVALPVDGGRTRAL